MAPSVKESDKALRYISNLDAARSNGRWDQVFELARKVEKHAPHRKTLVLTAKYEAEIAISEPPTDGGPSPLSKFIPPLLQAIDDDNDFLEDKFQASICLGWLHWVLNEPRLAIVRFPKDMVTPLNQAAEKSSRSLQWVQTCACKGAYLRGFAMEKTGSTFEALETYKSMLPFLSSLKSLGSMPTGFRTWAERLLVRLIARAMKSNPLGKTVGFDVMLQTFHLWTALFRSTPTRQKPTSFYDPGPRPSIVELGLEVEYTRWNMWTAYYSTLSELLRKGYLYSLGANDITPRIYRRSDGLSDTEFLQYRLDQRTELKSVEARMETKLLEETRFPRANERNERVELWVYAIMENWRIFCGPTWLDTELGEGGKNAIARGVLEILYRAATKTFHSTQILRYLFAVHSYLSEFDLAFKALNSYLDIVSRTKTRAKKSEEPDYSLDDDETILRTVCEALDILCHLGQRKEAEKARDIARKAEIWLNETEAEQISIASPSRGMNGVASPSLSTMPSSVSHETISLVYRLLGTVEARWSRLTYNAASRTSLQVKAAEYFRKALHPRLGNSKDSDAMFGLAVVLAEMRDIPGAMKIVKQALSESSSRTESQAVAEEFASERKLVRFWHLLTLLLSTRSDLETAVKVSNAAFEQFQDPVILFGSKIYRSEHLNESESLDRPSRAVVDKMDMTEREGILQVKLTQLALLEGLEGPSAAVEACADLLGLFARLFGDPTADLRAPKSTGVTLKAPKSAMSSLRSSMFWKSKKKREGKSNFIIGHSPSTARPSTVATSITAPTIQITDESNGDVAQRGRQMNGTVPSHPTFQRPSSRASRASLHRSPSGKLQKRSSFRARSLSSSRISTVEDTPATIKPMNGSLKVRPSTSASTHSRPFSSRTPSHHNTLHRRPSTSVESRPNLKSRHSYRGTFRSSKLPSTETNGDAPRVPILPTLPERRHKISLLTELWLFVSGLYARANDLDDAHAAIDEAAELVTVLENDISRTASGVYALAERGWGSGKSVEELWADVWAERGNLCLPQNPHLALSHFERALNHFPNHPVATTALSTILLDIYDEKITPELPDPDTTISFLPQSSHSSYSALPSPTTGILAATANRIPEPPKPTALTIASRTGTAEPGVESLTGPPLLSSSATVLSVTSIGAATNATGSTAAAGGGSTVRGRTASMSRMHSHGTMIGAADNNNNATGARGGTNFTGPLAADGDTPARPTAFNVAGSESDPALLNRLAARDRAYGLLSALTRESGGGGWDSPDAWFALARAYEACGRSGKAREVLWWCVELEDTRPVRGWGKVL